MAMAGSPLALYTQAPTHSTSTGHTRAHECPSGLASKIVRAAPVTLLEWICLMKSGMSIAVGQASMQGASWQNKQRAASARA